MNIVKTKILNKMLVSLLDALISIRMYFFPREICCRNFDPSANMVQDFTHKVVYPEMKNVIENKPDSDNAASERDEVELMNSVNEIDIPCISLQSDSYMFLVYKINLEINEIAFFLVLLKNSFSSTSLKSREIRRIAEELCTTERERERDEQWCWLDSISLYIYECVRVYYVYIYMAIFVAILV